MEVKIISIRLDIRKDEIRDLRKEVAALKVDP
jgi:hypothetical protein